MPSVNSQDRPEVQPLSHRNNACVYEVYVLVVVFAENFSRAGVVNDLGNYKLVGKRVN